jgi:membrane protease YdiL (CAAX protease family)
MSDAPEDNPATLFAALAGTAMLGVLAYILSLMFGTPLGPQMYWSLRDDGFGVLATAPPVLFLWWFMKTDRPMFARFRQSQIEFFANIGFRFTPLRIAIMALFAGFFEELLFRGVIQTGVALIAPVPVAILIAGIVFGVVHWRTWLYALIAGVLGVWLGVLFALTGNLLAPMITHALYDVAAFIATARAIDAWRAGKMQSEETTAN